MIKYKAKTIKEIKGSGIPVIKVGTKFIITYYGEQYSSCEKLPIHKIWNDEFEFTKE